MENLTGLFEQGQQLLTQGDGITRRLDVLIERAKILPEEKAEMERLGKLMLEANERDTVAKVLGDFLTRDNKPSAESIWGKMDKRGRG